MIWPCRSTLLKAFLFALVGFLTWVAAHGLWSFLDGLSSKADWIDVNAGSAGALPAAVAIGIWSAILTGRRLTARTERRAMRLSFLCVPLIVLLPLAFSLLVDHALSEQGYERCRVEIGHRFPGARYHRGAPKSCP